MVNIDKEMSSKEQAEEFLRDVIMKYLEKLQGGVFGPPNLGDLTNAGNLHAFLEEMHKDN